MIEAALHRLDRPQDHCLRARQPETLLESSGASKADVFHWCKAKKGPFEAREKLFRSV